MKYRIGTYPDGHIVWFEQGVEVSNELTNVRDAPDHIAQLAQSILAQDANGSISDHTASQMRSALADLQV